jgi:hypothetical protein
MRKIDVFRYSNKKYKNLYKNMDVVILISKALISSSLKELITSTMPSLNSFVMSAAAHLLSIPSNSKLWLHRVQCQWADYRKYIYDLNFSDSTLCSEISGWSFIGKFFELVRTFSFRSLPTALKLLSAAEN